MYQLILDYFSNPPTPLISHEADGYWNHQFSQNKKVPCMTARDVPPTVHGVSCLGEGERGTLSW